MAKRDLGRQNEEEFDDYWNSGRNGNMEEYEKYLRIRSMLEGKRYRPPRGSRVGGRRISLLNYYPMMRPVLYLLLFANLTRIALAYEASGAGKIFYPVLACWGIASLFIYWYFSRRDPLNGTLRLIDAYCPGIEFIRAVPYWLFLGGWILAVFSLNDLKIWAEWIVVLSYKFGKPINFAWLDTFLATGCPEIPSSLRTLGSLSALFAGGLTVLDAVAAKFMD